MARASKTLSNTGAAAVDSPQAHAALLALAEPGKAVFLAGYFKTGKGQYGEGDQFLGVVVPAVRQLARRYIRLPLPEVGKLLASPYNEERLLALLILVEQYRKGDLALREQVHQAYMGQRDRINNWNLVDSSAPDLVGQHLLKADRSVLYQLAQSPVLWDRRIAVLATLAFIRAADYTDTLRLCAMLLTDAQDLMHKACGWMLREVGRRDGAALAGFLCQHQRVMPRTMLRYAIERLPTVQRQAVLAGTFTLETIPSPTERDHLGVN
jgi:3-methyladenine DNA glycosylase AlkD